MPEGAFYIFRRVSDLYSTRGGGSGISGSMDFADRLLEEARVAIVPGLPFGSNKHIRISYSDSLQRLTEGMDRLGSFLRALTA